MDIYALIWKEKEKKELGTLLACNEKTQRFGLCLTEEQARELVICRNNSLKKYQRVEFGSGILDKLIYVSAILRISMAAAMRKRLKSFRMSFTPLKTRRRTRSRTMKF